MYPLDANGLITIFNWTNDKITSCICLVWTEDRSSTAQQSALNKDDVGCRVIIDTMMDFVLVKFG